MVHPQHSAQAARRALDLALEILSAEEAASSAAANSSSGSNSSANSGLFSPAGGSGTSATGGRGAGVSADLRGGGSSAGNGSSASGADVSGGGTIGTTGNGGINQLAQNYASLPLPFEPNLGQTDPSVQFLSHGPGFGVFLTGDGAATFDLTRPGQSTTPGDTITRDALRLSLAGASRDAAASCPRTSCQATATTSRQHRPPSPTCRSTAPSSKRTSIRASTSSGTPTPNRELEYNFVVAPGADPSAHRPAHRRQHRPESRRPGRSAHRHRRRHSRPGRPRHHPDQAPAAKRKPSAAAPCCCANGDVGFQVGSYDTTQPLTIDPVLLYSSYLGGSGSDKAYAVAADGSGDIYVAGTTTSTNFPTTVGAYETSSPAKRPRSSPSSTRPATSTSTPPTSPAAPSVPHRPPASPWTRPATPTSPAPPAPAPSPPPAARTIRPTPAAVSRSRLSPSSTPPAIRCCTSTYFGSAGPTPAPTPLPWTPPAMPTSPAAPRQPAAPHFPTTSGAFQTSAGAGTHAFVTKLNAAGSALVYSTFLGGSGTDNGYGIAVDTAGDAYVTGQAGTGWHPTSRRPAAAYHTAYAGRPHRLRHQGQPGRVGPGLLDAPGRRRLGDQGNAIAIDAVRRCLCHGIDLVVNFPTTSGAFQTRSGGANRRLRHQAERRRQRPGLFDAIWAAATGPTPAPASPWTRRATRRSSARPAARRNGHRRLPDDGGGRADAATAAAATMPSSHAWPPTANR